ncbi:MAG: RsmE family RNA methyltransferase [Polyangiales bacterium]
MTVRRLYVPDLPEQGGAVTLAEAPCRHVRVLRLRVGDQVVLFDGKSRVARARLESIGDEVLCRADPPSLTETARARVVLMLALPKGSKLEDCVRMATELGVDEVALMDTERSIPQWAADRARSRVDRLTRIASEAAAQCERNDVPIIHDPRSCGAWLNQVPDDAKGILFEARAPGHLRLGGIPERVWCAVGPEGGFTDTEIALFQGAGFSVASLGTRILRVETAVAAALTIVLDRLEVSGEAR